MSDYRKREEVFRTAVLWLHERAGEDAVVRAFGDPEPLDAAWEIPLPEFKEVLRSMVRDALKEEKRGAA